MLNKTEARRVCVDARSMMGVVGEIAQASHGIQHSLYASHSELKTLTSSVSALHTKVDMVIDLLQKFIGAANDESPSAKNPTVTRPMSWITIKAELERTSCVCRKFVIWHVDRGAESYQEWTKLEKMSEKSKKSPMSKFASNYKSFSSKMEKLAGIHVPQRPTGDAMALVQWEFHLMKIAKLALQSAKTSLNCDKLSYTAVRGIKLE